jgi:hypothetical protein
MNRIHRIGDRAASVVFHEESRKWRKGERESRELRLRG